MESNIIKNENLASFEKIAVIGAAQASKTLAMIVGQPVKVVVVKNRVLFPTTLYQHIGEAEEAFTMVVFRIERVTNGFALVAFPEQDGDKFGEMVRARYNKGSADVKNDQRKEQADYSKESIIKETSNIIVGSFLSAIHKEIKINLIQSVPNIATDMIKAMMDEIIAEISQTSQNILVFETKLIIKPNDIHGKFFLISDSESANEMLQSRT